MSEINVEALVKERTSHWEEISRKHFPESEDLSLVVLKTHLILEHHFTALIAHYCPFPQYLPDARLKFSQKLYLVQALVLMPINDDIWATLKLLNTIRNDLAHNLEPPKLADHLSSAKALATSVAAKAVSGPKPTFTTDAFVIKYLAGYAEGYLQAVDNLVAVMETQRKYA
jgi:hypothetical protein